jgi:hypothetical protein
MSRWGGGGGGEELYCSLNKYMGPIVEDLTSGGNKEMSSVSWLTNSALVYEPKCWGGGGGA